MGGGWLLSPGFLTLAARDTTIYAYNALGLLRKVERADTIVVNYSYLADGTKAVAERGDGSGLVYRGSLTYRKDSTGVLTLESAPSPTGRITPDGMRYHITDHLGSVRAVIDGQSGEILESSNYGVYGGRGTAATNAWPTASAPAGETLRDHFTGKEDQAPDFHFGITDFGARPYSPSLSRWLTPDPLAEKYYDVSPYSYCAGDPVNLVDPDGTTITISATLEDGTKETFTYSANAEYTGNNAFIAKSVNLLNEVYSNGGSKVLDKLVQVSDEISIINQLGREGNFQFVGAEAGGIIYAGALMSDSYEPTLGIESMSHEIFHGLQQVEGQGGASIFNEVEAYAFGYMIYNNYQKSSNGLMQHSIAGEGLENDAGVQYEKAFSRIVSSNKMIRSFFPDAVNNFKKGARVNLSGTYNSFPMLLTNQRYHLLFKYYPQ